jgi:hypothetical protein
VAVPLNKFKAKTKTNLKKFIIKKIVSIKTKYNNLGTIETWHLISTKPGMTAEDLSRCQTWFLLIKWMNRMWGTHYRKKVTHIKLILYLLSSCNVGKLRNKRSLERNVASPKFSATPILFNNKNKTRLESLPLLSIIRQILLQHIPTFPK